MNQIEFKENQIILRVKRSPLLGRILLYLITLLSIVLLLGGCSSLNKINGNTNPLGVIK